MSEAAARATIRNPTETDGPQMVELLLRAFQRWPGFEIPVPALEQALPESEVREALRDRFAAGFTIDDARERLRFAFTVAHFGVLAEASRSGSIGMATAMVAAWLQDGVFHIGHVGDSRAYLVRGGRCTQLTRDQSFENFAVQRGLMSPEEVEKSAHRNVILQALGPNSSVEADLTYQHLRLDDVLVLCSDGLFRVVQEPEIAAATAMDVAEGCDALVAMAKERGAPDNVTVLLARFGGDGLRPPTASDPVGRQPLPERGG